MDYARVCMLVSLCAIGAKVYAEGSFQTGLTQPLIEASDSTYGFPQSVDVLIAGEVINISLCGENNNDDVRVQIFDPGNTSVFDTTLSDGNVTCNDTFTAPLTNPLRYVTTVTGTYTVHLDNISNTELDRFDITITPDALIDPDPTLVSGRLWSNRWVFYTHSFAESFSTDTDYFALVPGGRSNTDYVWKLDLNNFSGNRYEIIANDLGVDAPNSGFSVSSGSNSVVPKFPVYVGYPAVANDRPVDPPVISNFRFIDSDGQDYGISPNNTATVQDSGDFEFTIDVDATYSIIIDTNSDGVFAAGDKAILGLATAGTNQVTWDGTDVNGAALPTGTYRALIQLRLGEYHFISNDAETSGGPSADGLTIFLANSDGSSLDTRVFWDDATFLGATTTLPDGELSSTSAGKHTWGDFSSGGIGNNAYIDTYVYGLASSASALTAITSDDSLLTGSDGTVTLTPATAAPGATLTLSVSDADLDLIPAVQESVFVVVTNARTGEVEQVGLTESTINSPVFDNTLVTVDTATASIDNDGSMHVQAGDVLTVTYLDQLDSSGASVNRTDQHNAAVTDTDGDSISDAIDIDDDNDGIPDSLEGDGSIDTDGDGIADSLDLDSDNDGLFDLHESGANVSALDSDNDGRIDGTNTIGSNGLADAVETSADSGVIAYNGGALLDTDLDTVKDFRDLDSDNDGIPDVTESNGNDPDSDGIVGSGNPVVDADGVATSGAGLTAPDSDSDGVTDQLDLDSDDDGIVDLLEAGGTDSDNNGTVDGFTDIDGDGFDDATTSSPLPVTDSDGDGTPDYLDNGDADQDGILDTIDIDDDNDGIPDSVEGDGAVDTDGDGIADSVDLDSDNDGLFDLSESGADANTLDTNNDGRIDIANPIGSNGLGDAVETSADSGVINYNGGVPLDTDSDGVDNYRDLDSDNDGIPDVAEAGGTNADPDGDGILGTGTPAVDVNGVPSIGAGLTAPDTDLDGVTDPLDLDSDDDGFTDLLEAGGNDSDDNGLVDGFTDIDGDGFDDSITVLPLTVPDFDGDGIPDFQDNDDADNDGLVDTFDIDDDNDGIPDSIEGDGAVDTDGDGIADSLDLDSDNDGLFDLHESGADASVLDSDNDGRIDLVNAIGSNGLADAVETSADSGAINYNGGVPLDTDSDGVDNYRDLDSDNDGIYDVTEAQGNDSDRDGVIGSGIPAVNAMGLAPGSGLLLPDFDLDGVADPLDLDSDNDGIPDVIEAAGDDSDGDGIVGAGVPTVDSSGVALTGVGLVSPDTDSDGQPDNLDVDADGDNNFDLVEAGGVDVDNDGLVDNFMDLTGNGFDDALTGNPLPLPDANGNGIPDFKEQANQKPLLTGLNGTGCVVGNASAIDPALPVLVLIALFYLGLGARLKKTALYMAGLLLVLPLLQSPVASADESKSVFQLYGGVGLGISRLTPDGNGTIYDVDNEYSGGYKLTLGADVTERISIEGYFSELGEAKMSPDGEIEYQDFGLAGLYHFYQSKEMHRGWAAYAKAGIGWMENESDLNFKRVNNAHLMFGLGAGYGFKNGLMLRADIDLYDEDSQFFSINLIKRFGKTESKQEIDSDGDGIANRVDACPDTVMGVVIDSVGCVAKPVDTGGSGAVAVVSSMDSDRDSVSNSLDKCPDTMPNVTVDQSGCAISLILEGVQFEPNKDELTSNSKSILEQVARSLMQGANDQAIRIVGHTDSLGPAAYNMHLSERRSIAVHNFLVSQGMVATMLSSIGKGESEPIADNTTREGRAINRRVELMW